MKLVTLVGGAVGVLLLIALALQSDGHAMLRALSAGGWNLAWLLPYRALFFALYALGWGLLLRPGSHRPPTFPHLFWVTCVREAVDRLLPVASVGGSVIGVRLMLWQGHAAAVVSASVIIEVVLTLVSSYLFAILGLTLLTSVGPPHPENHRVLVMLLLSLPVPLAMVLTLRYGSIFERLAATVRAVSGLKIPAARAAELDHQVRSLLCHHRNLWFALVVESIALLSVSAEIWFAMWLFGRPISAAQAVILESMTVVLRHLAFFVPGAIGVQEAGLILFGQVLGINGEFALAVSMVKRARELLWGMPSLLSWQWLEARRVIHRGRAPGPRYTKP